MRSRTTLRALAASALVLAAAGTVAATAHAAPVLDQSNTAHSENYLTATPVGQTFTVGVTGTLTRVDLGATTATGTVLAVRAVEGGTVTGPDLASGPAVHDPEGNWATLELETGLPVTAGEQYAILTTERAAFAFMFSRQDPYAGGTYVQTHDPTARTGWSPQMFAHLDQRFRTFVEADVAPTIDGTPPIAVVDAAYDFTYDVSGHPVPEVALADGPLPDGIVLDADGTLHGTPTESGTFPLTLTASNGVGDDVLLETELVVDALPTVDGNPVEGTVGEQYLYAFELSGAPAPTVTTEDELPAGLTLTEGGVLQGTPTAPGSTTFTVRATNRAGEGEREVTVDVVAAAVPDEDDTEEPTATPSPDASEQPDDDGTEDGGAGQDDSGDESRGDDDAAPTDAGTEGDELATTGRDLRPLALSGIVVALAGALLVAVATRRNRTLQS